MGRPRNPERDKARDRYLDSDGQITTAQLAKEAGVPPARIRKWKSEDGWGDLLKNKPRKRGGQKGNQNAKGRTPSKDGNKNAVTHGAYATVSLEELKPEAAEKVRLAMETQGALARMTNELQDLYVRKVYLEGQLAIYESAEAQDKLYVDKVMHMVVPKSIEQEQKEKGLGISSGCPDPEGTTGEHFKTAMKNVIKSSASDRAMKIEEQLNKLHGRIIKQLDSIKAYELEDRRLRLAEKEYSLKKQRLTGAYDIDPGTGEVIDEDETAPGGME